MSQEAKKPYSQESESIRYQLIYNDDSRHIFSWPKSKGDISKDLLKTGKIKEVQIVG